MASSCASASTRFARSLNRSNGPIDPLLRRRRRLLCRRLLLRHQLEDLLPRLGETDPEGLDDPGRDSLALPYETEQQMGRADLRMAQPLGFIHRELDHLLG